MIKKLLRLSLALLLVLGAQSFAIAQDPQPYYKDYSDNRGGLNTKASHFAVLPNQSPDCQNVYYGEDFAIIQRSGFTTLLGTALTDQYTGIYTYVQADGDDWLIVTNGSTIRQSASLTTVSLTDITGSVTITADYLFDFETFRDTVVATNGVDPPIKWEGTGNATAASVPAGLTTAKWVGQFKNYLGYANVTVDGTKYPSRFYFSELLDIDTWNALDFIDISRDDGEEITGVETLGDRLVIFKETKLFILLYTGDPDIPFTLYEVPSNGCASGYSIKKIGGLLIYLAYDGIYQFDGSYSTIISDRISPTIAEADPSMFSVAVAANYETLNQYWLSITDGVATDTSNDRIIVWDWYNDAFSVYKGINAAYLYSFRTSGTEYLYSGDYDGELYQQDDGTNDNGVAIEAYHWTAWLTADAPLGMNKAMKHMYVFLKHVGAWNLNVGYNYDFGKTVWRSKDVSMADASTLVGQAIVGESVLGGSDGLIRRVDLTGQGKVVRFRFYNDTLDHHFNVRGYGLYLIGLGYR